MQRALPIQDIEEMRLQAGIDDVELRLEIRALQIGDCVKLSLMTGDRSFETVSVRITSMKGSDFRGKLADPKTCSCTSKRLAGLTVDFTTAHIHSIVKKECLHDR